LFKQLLGRDDDTDASGDLRAAALLSAEMKHIEGGSSPPPSIAQLASFLDSGSSEEQIAHLHAQLAASPIEVEEVASADAFVAAVEAARLAAPNELVAAAICQHRPLPENGGRKRTFDWRWLGLATLGAVAAGAVAITLLNSRVLPSPQDKQAKGPIHVEEKMLPAGAETIVPAGKCSGPPAGCTQERPQMAPAGSLERMPMPKHGGTRLVPELQETKGQ
jgi:hypothetical protein